MNIDADGHRPGEGLKDSGRNFTYDGEVIPDEVRRSSDSAKEEVS